MSSALHCLLQGDPSYAVNWSAVLRAIEEDPAEASEPDATGRVPISLALSKTDPPPPAHVVAALLEAAPSSPTRADANGRTPLFFACSNSALGEDALAVLGLDRSRTNRGPDPNGSSAPLPAASFSRHPTVVVDSSGSPASVQSTPDCSTDSNDGLEATAQQQPQSTPVAQPLPQPQPRARAEAEARAEMQARADASGGEARRAVPQLIQTSTTTERSGLYTLAVAGANEPPGGSWRDSLVSQVSSRFDVGTEFSGDYHDRPTDEDNPDMTEEIRKEHRAVNYVKVFIIVLLVVSAIVVTFLAFYLARGQENQKFALQYSVFSQRAVGAFSHNMDMKVWTAYSSLAMFSHYTSSWPNVTVPDFEEKTRGMLLLAHARSVGFAPVVTDETRSDWETYAAGEEEAGRVLGANGSVRSSSASTLTSASASAWDGADRPFSHTMMDEDVSDAAGEMADVSANGNAGPGLRGRRRRQAEKEHSMGVDHSEDGGVRKGHMFHPNDDMGRHANDKQVEQNRTIADGIYKMDGTSFVDEDDTVGPYLPVWQIAPLESNKAGIMYNQYSEPIRRRAIQDLLNHKHPTLTEILYDDFDWHADEDHHKEPSSILFYPILDRFGGSSIVGMTSITFSWASMFMNILPSDVKGVICVLETNTGQSFTYEMNGMEATFLGEGDLHDPKYDHMEFVHSYSLHDRDAYMDGNRTGHVGHRRLSATAGRGLEGIAGIQHSQHGSDMGTESSDREVTYTVKIYPSDTFQASYLTKSPMIYAVVVALIFFFTSATFLIYDCLVQRRQTAVMQSAIQSNKIVHSFFPAVVRDRLFRDAEDEIVEAEEQEEHDRNTSRIQRISGRLPRRMSHTGSAERTPGRMPRRMSHTGTAGSSASLLSKCTSLPIADLFTDTTILFADIAGFTAWSSEREPAQVFQLLEALFREFDAEARKQGVFKVETIGDCYVAVTGLPDPRPDHAVVMARFAQRCLTNFSFLTSELELSLGPGTAELGMRIGLHSGPVTAGVLRGEKARFQLFGDTMNTASRMESTGRKNMVQVSQQTADLLIAAGKENFIVPREDVVHAKGKGAMQTYWLKPKVSRRNSSQFSSSGTTPWHFEQVQGPAEATSEEKPVLERHESFFAIDTRTISKKRPSFYDSNSWTETGLKDAEVSTMQPSALVQRLIKWNSAVLEKLLVNVMDNQNMKSRRRSSLFSIDEAAPSSPALFSEEVAEAVQFQRFDRETAISTSKTRLGNSTSLPPEARNELHEYVTRIASMYRNVHFHNFEHASHVTMSANKLMNKVCSRDFDNGGNNAAETRADGDSKGVGLFFSTFGISSDPLAQLAVVFAALVHDVDHRGVPNVRLIQEIPELGEQYKNKSVAENNSIHIAWSVLMEPDFDNLRRCMFATDADMDRFRQLLINVVIATDIADRKRMQKEKARWKKAFRDISFWKDEWQAKKDDELARVDVSLKATVVLEQIMLASDVAHTMQHWLTFVKWNERLYRELWSAYASGRADNDPTLGWYEGQISFFDGYIIPLASKLKECGVFGSAGAEYLGHALSNRAEWKEKGKEITERFERTIRNNPDADDEPNYWNSH